MEPYLKLNRCKITKICRTTRMEVFVRPFLNDAKQLKNSGGAVRLTKFKKLPQCRFRSELAAC